MTDWTLIKRSLRFHWRSHLGVVLGAAIGSAALIGALIVGDSVRESLRERALARLGSTHFAIDAADRLFEADLPQRILNGMREQNSRRVISVPNSRTLVTQVTYSVIQLTNRNGQPVNTLVTGGLVTNVVPAMISTGTSEFGHVAGLLHVSGTAANNDGTARANQVNVYGVNMRLAEFAGARPPLNDEAILNESLATHLGVRVGDSVLLRVRKPEAVSAESPVSTSDSSVALRLRVREIVGDQQLGNFSLRASQVPPYNAFIALSFFQSKLGADGRANEILFSGIEESVTSARNPFLRQWARKLNPRWQWARPIFSTRTNSLPDDVAFARLETGLRRSLTLEDLQLHFRWPKAFGELEARSSRIFIEPALSDLLASTPAGSETAPPVRILTYLVNQFRVGELTTPYSMVTATDSPLLPSGLHDDEIVINQWLADDLNAQPGTEIALTYFAPDQAAQLIERTNRFRVRAVIAMTNPLCDRGLMPDFPGVAQAEHAGDWNTSFPLVHKIRPKDDQYWQKFRGTPKAFVSLAAGQKMWANRFGNLTALRWRLGDSNDDKEAFNRVRNAEATLRSAFSMALNPATTTGPRLDPAMFGLQLQPVREQALRAAEQSQDFGGLFIGFSFFLIGAALILMGLLFAFGLQQRREEIGTLLALGFTPKRVRKLFLLEGAALAFIGSVIGVVGGSAYAKAMLHGLTTVWRSATNASALRFHVSPATLLMGLVSGSFVAVLTIWIVLRKQARRPARELLVGETSAEKIGNESSPNKSSVWQRIRRLASAATISCASFIFAIATIGWAFVSGEASNPEFFFTAGSLALIAGLGGTSWFLQRLMGTPHAINVRSSILSVRSAARRKSRSVATVALLACGVFLIVSIGAFRLDADANAWKRSSGTGGFALIGESTLPIVKDLNRKEGRDALGLDEKILQGVSFVPFRVREGDDASCLNLNRAQQPRLLGAQSDLLHGRFSFAMDAPWRWTDLGMSNKIDLHGDRVPAIGDAASIQWALHKKIGDTLAYRDEHGNDFDARLVGGLANSILQGSLIIDEAEFTKRFPSISGYRMFLIDCPSNALPQVGAELVRALQDYGFEVTPAVQRLAAFNAVQNTYLNTFQVLGGLGLLLGSFGLGIVVLRNVLERRGELALLVAVGFRRSRVQRLVLAEHTALLGLGLGIGIVSALVAILPSLLSPRTELPVRSLALTLGGVLLFGLISTWLATRASVRGNLLEGLRNE